MVEMMRFFAALVVCAILGMAMVGAAFLIISLQGVVVPNIHRG
jgi:hypothetical protein